MLGVFKHRRTLKLKSHFNKMSADFVLPFHLATTVRLTLWCTEKCPNSST